MTDLITDTASRFAAIDADQLTPIRDRRRPGRPDEVSPALTGLLRWHPNSTGRESQAAGQIAPGSQWTVSWQRLLVGTGLALVSWSTSVLMFRSIAAQVIG